MLLSKEQKQLRKRILEISHRARLSHLGSCFSAIDLLIALYKIKKKKEPFVLSNGHSGVALYAVLESYKLLNNHQISDTLFAHPDRDMKKGIYASSGSLGQGLPIAVGMALSKKKRHVFCMVSDGECSEGSIWEAIDIAVKNKLDNLKIIVNANGWGAYDPIPLPRLIKKFKGFGCKVVKVNGHNIEKIKKALSQKSRNLPLIIFAKTSVEEFPFLKGLDAHYHIITAEEYKQAIKKLET